jgi:hypothetical protein
MKNPIPPEIKAKIFAQHIGCEAICKVDNAVYFDKNEVIILDFYYLSERMRILEHYAILLTPLSEITNEHAIECIFLLKPGNRIKNIVVVNDGIYFREKLTYQYAERKVTLHELMNRGTCNYLRSLGYAVDFTASHEGKPVTYTVDELVEQGIVILKIK